MVIFIIFAIILLAILTLFVSKYYARLFHIKNKMSVFYFGLWIFFYLLFVLRFIHIDVIYENVIFYNIILYGATVYCGIVVGSAAFLLLLFLINTLLRKIRFGYPWLAKKRQISIILLIITIAITLFSMYHANVISVKTFNYHIQKESLLDKLHIAYISDLHLGTTMQEQGLEDLVEKINSLDPDIIVLGGDIYDENTPKRLLEKSANIFSKLKAKDGVYYVFGNHEFYTDSKSIYEYHLKQAKITILDDQTIEVKNQFTLVGRVDERKNKDRKTLDELLVGVDLSKPVILLDHQPIVDENNQVDLQISGHTHNGQIFPNNLLIPFVNPYVYGIYKTNSHTLIVSSGVGAWGVPMRLGSDSEIVDIYLTFNKKP